MSINPIRPEPPRYSEQETKEKGQEKYKKETEKSRPDTQQTTRDDESFRTAIKTKKMERKMSYEYRNHRVSVVETFATTMSHSVLLKVSESDCWYLFATS